MTDIWTSELSDEHDRFDEITLHITNSKEFQLFLARPELYLTPEDPTLLGGLIIRDLAQRFRTTEARTENIIRYEIQTHHIDWAGTWAPDTE